METWLLGKRDRYLDEEHHAPQNKRHDHHGGGGMLFHEDDNEMTDDSAGVRTRKCDLCNSDHYCEEEGWECSGCRTFQCYGCASTGANM